jgi:hypothetical protein
VECWIFTSGGSLKVLENLICAHDSGGLGEIIKVYFDYAKCTLHNSLEVMVCYL